MRSAISQHLRQPAARRRRCAATSTAGSRRLDPAELCTAITAGLRNDEVRGGLGLVTACSPPTTSSSTRCPTCCSPATPASGCRGRVVVTSLAMPARRRETPADRADLRIPPALRRHSARPRLAARARRGRRRAAAGAGRGRGRRRRADDTARASSDWPARRSPRASPTPCSRCRSRRSGRPCTWTPSARWSTSTPS